MRLEEFVTKPLKENIEDEQASLNEHAVTLLMMLGRATNHRKEYRHYYNRWDQATNTFSEGYDSDDNNLMYGSLDDLEQICKELEKLVKQIYGDQFSETYRKTSEQTSQFR